MHARHRTPILQLEFTWVVAAQELDHVETFLRIQRRMVDRGKNRSRKTSLRTEAERFALPLECVILYRMVANVPDHELANDAIGPRWGTPHQRHRKRS